MKVLLVSTNTLTQPYPTYPIGLDYVMQALVPQHQVMIADMNELTGGPALAAVCDRYRPDVIGLSIRNIDNLDEANVKTFLGEVADIIAVVRRHAPGLIVLGGSGFTILPEECMRRLDADYGIIGEGERFPDLLQAIARHEPASGLPGVVTRNGPAVPNPGPWPGTFSRSFAPDCSHVGLYLKRGGMLNLQTKRGCPFRCIYCTYPRIEGAQFRFTPPQEVAAMARQLQDGGARYLYITDGTFNGSAEHSLAVAAEFQKVGLTIPWGGFFTPLRPSRDYYPRLADAGLAHVEFGTESLAAPVLTAYGKPFRRDDVVASHRLAVAAGLHVAHYLLLGGPGEQEATLRETLAGADELEHAAFFVFTGIRIFPHTGLYALARAEGQVQATTDLLEPVFYWSPRLKRETAVGLVAEHARGRRNWVVGSGATQMFKGLARLHERGHVGPLWERLIR